MNEETIIENNAQMNEETRFDSMSTENVNEAFEEVTSLEQGLAEKQKSSTPWATITLGGISAVLLGAGLAFGGSAFAKRNNDTTTEETKPEEGTEQPTEEPITTTEPSTEQTTEHSQALHQNYNFAGTSPVASIDTGLSFDDAFAMARTEVGPGGVFCWNGGVYSTFTTEEWNGMTEAEQAAFAKSVPVVVPASEITRLPDNSSPEIEVEVPTEEEGEVVAETSTEDESHVSDLVDATINEEFDVIDNAEIVAVGTEDGHLKVSYDVNGDGETDFSIIDVDHSISITNEDIITHPDGTTANINELPHIDEQEEDGLYTDSCTDSAEDVSSMDSDFSILA